MGSWWSKPTRETPAMEAIEQHNVRVAELERQKASLESRNANLEAQIKKIKAKEKSTELETLRVKASLLDEKTMNEEMAEALRVIDERTRDVRPAQWPTPEQVEATKRQYGYSPEKFHVAISGQSGTGKSSLINALRGLYPDNEQAAVTDDVECTMVVTRYPDPDPNKSIVWFDVPGAGTQSHPEAEYFNDKGLYIFDAVLVVFGDRFGSTDIAILRQCGLYRIPTYIVRSKADVHVRNRYDDAVEAEYRNRKIKQKKHHGLSRDEEARLFENAKRGFENAARKSVKKELNEARLKDQPVFLVSCKGLLSRVRRMEGDGAKTKFEEGSDNPGAESDGEGEVGDEGDEDAPYVVFDEDKLLADLIYASLRRSIMNSLSKMFPAWAQAIKRRFGSKPPAHEPGPGGLDGST